MIPCYIVQISNDCCQVIVKAFWSLKLHFTFLKHTFHIVLNSFIVLFQKYYVFSRNERINVRHLYPRISSGPNVCPPTTILSDSLFYFQFPCSHVFIITPNIKPTEDRVREVLRSGMRESHLSKLCFPKLTNIHQSQLLRCQRHRQPRWQQKPKRSATLEK